MSLSVITSCAPDTPVKKTCWNVFRFLQMFFSYVLLIGERCINQNILYVTTRDEQVRRYKTVKLFNQLNDCEFLAAWAHLMAYK